jgi:predicted RNase H-related nuclease YkuK (DUF458 family)
MYYLNIISIMSTDNILFYNDTLKRHIGFDELIEEIKNYIHQEPRAKYKITIGTDSNASAFAQFVTAITILRVGNGGRYFWTKSEKIFCPTLRDRIYKETMQSITFTQELKSHLKEKIGEDFFWNEKISVHIDVGQNGPTKELVESVVGMVRGYGLEAVIKPDSFGAFVVADRHT